MSDETAINETENTNQEIESTETEDNSFNSEAALLKDVEDQLAKMGKEDEEKEPDEEAEAEPEKEEDKKEVAKKEDEKLAARFAALSRREKEVRAREQQSKADMDQVNAFRKGILEGKENPKGVIDLLKQHGITFEDLARAEMDDQNLAKDLNTRKLEARLEAVEKQRLADLHEAQQRVNQAQLDGFKNDIASFIKSNAEKYEMVADAGLVDDVFGIIEKDAKKNIGNKNYQLKSIESAVSELEDSLTAHANKILKLKKFSKPVEKLEDIESEARDTKASKTLSNKLTPAPKVKVKVKETEADRERAAIKLLNDAWRE
jgi:hypothetical protein